MTGKVERGMHELYGDDPERADALVFGRRTGRSRRGFLKGAGLATMGAAVGASLPFAGGMPGGLVPAALAQAPAEKGPKILKMDGKANLVVLGDKPLVAETPAELLDDDVTPTEKFFIRNNGLTPEASSMPSDPKAWKVKIDGEVNTPLEIALGDLMTKYQAVTLKLMLECGGNGRSFFSPEARGNQWTNGGAGCAEWTGVRLSDLLKAAGLKPGAVYTGHYGADVHLSGDASKPSISRGVRIAKAMDEHTLVAFKMNGKDIPAIHGGPVRLIVPGWAGSASHKWLTRIWIRDKEHDGPGMGGFSYRTAKTPIVPGSKGDPKDTAILESMPVRSIVTFPAHGARLAKGTRKIDLRGHAWAGDNAVQSVDVSIDYGVTWKKAEVKAPANKFAWQRFTASVDLPGAGYYEVWCKATDTKGVTQPFLAGNWNPQGYGGNPVNRIAVLVEA
ncbi:MAG: sulfite oxidase [Rhodospirillales bacterium]|nr:MAG: sulfite oxidase [Rhodospirillales bacterium]